MLTLEYLDPRDLTPQARNPWHHPEAQADSLAGVIDQAGWAGAALLNRTTGRLIDGHLRREEAIRRGELLPTLVDEWSEAQERLLIATINPIAMLAEGNREQLADLAASVTADVDAGLLQTDERLDAIIQAIVTEPTDEDEEGPELERGDVPDALFPTDNEWQIPLLDIKRQADAVDLPVVTWGSIARTSRIKGTWHFYTDDDRYIELWVDPSPVPNTGCVNCVEPNFSVYDQMPRAVGLYRIYQKRWIARYWQSLGIRVFVDLNVSAPFADLNLLGVPEGWRAYATRGYTDQLGALDREHGLAVERAGSDDVLFLVYGGGKAVIDLCGRRGWVHIEEHMDRVRAERSG